CLRVIGNCINVNRGADLRSGVNDHLADSEDAHSFVIGVPFTAHAICISQRCQPFPCANASLLILINQSTDSKSATARHGASLSERMKRRQPRSMERPLPSCISTTNSGRPSGWMLSSDCDSVAKLAFPIVFVFIIFCSSVSAADSWILSPRRGLCASPD